MEGGPTPFFYRHVPKNVLLVLLSVLCLPFSLGLTAIALLLRGWQKPNPSKEGGIHSGHKTILVTGISMTKGLTIARLLAQSTPHRIIAADTESVPFTSPGRYSRSIAKFYAIEEPINHKKSHYIQTLLNILKFERVNLWISCSSVTDAIEDGEVMKIAQEMLGSNFKAVQFDRDAVEKLHEKDLLMDYLRSLGLAIPESHRCTSVGQVEQILSGVAAHDGSGDGSQKRFILKPIGVDDKARAQMMTLLPLARGGPAATSSYLESLNISPERPFQLQQFIQGPEYCTHSLVVQGRVKAFVACPSSDLLMHYQALPPNSALNQKMLEFTEQVCRHEGESFSGHLSFDFLAEETGEDATLYPIECNPRAHTAVVLFRDTPQMARAYLSLFTGRDVPESDVLATPASPVDDYYWIGHDLVTFLIIPVLAFACGAGSFSEVQKGLKTLSYHLVYWRDGTFAIWDPLPFLILYHVYWPIRFGQSLARGQQWSRLNVSTTKMFQC